jgi:hypothetical protein
VASPGQDGVMLADPEGVHPGLLGEDAPLARLRIVWACEAGLPSASPLRSPKVPGPKVRVT